MSDEVEERPDKSDVAYWSSIDRTRHELRNKLHRIRKYDLKNNRICGPSPSGGYPIAKDARETAIMSEVFGHPGLPDESLRKILSEGWLSAWRNPATPLLVSCVHPDEWMGWLWRAVCLNPSMGIPFWVYVSRPRFMPETWLEEAANFGWSDYSYPALEEMWADPVRVLVEEALTEKDRRLRKTKK